MAASHFRQGGKRCQHTPKSRHVTPTSKRGDDQNHRLTRIQLALCARVHSGCTQTRLIAQPTTACGLQVYTTEEVCDERRATHTAGEIRKNQVHQPRRLKRVSNLLINLGIGVAPSAAQNVRRHKRFCNDRCCLSGCMLLPFLF